MTTISEDNERAIQEGVKEALQRAGVYSIYHEMKLEDVPHGTEYKQALLSGDVSQQLALGRGWTIYGGGPGAYDLFLVMARALMLTSVAVQVTTPDKIVAAYDFRNEEQQHRYASVPVLFVSRFTQHGECPYTRWQRRKIETLLEERLDGGKPIYIQSSTMLGEWWPTELTQRLSKNVVLEINS